MKRLNDIKLESSPDGEWIYVHDSTDYIQDYKSFTLARYNIGLRFLYVVSPSGDVKIYAHPASGDFPQAQLPNNTYTVSNGMLVTDANNKNTSWTIDTDAEFGIWKVYLVSLVDYFTDYITEVYTSILANEYCCLKTLGVYSIHKAVDSLRPSSESANFVASTPIDIDDIVESGQAVLLTINCQSEFIENNLNNFQAKIIPSFNCESKLICIKDDSTYNDNQSLPYSLGVPGDYKFGLYSFLRITKPSGAVVITSFGGDDLIDGACYTTAGEKDGVYKVEFIHIPEIKVDLDYIVGDYFIHRNVGDTIRTIRKAKANFTYDLITVINEVSDIILADASVVDFTLLEKLPSNFSNTVLLPTFCEYKSCISKICSDKNNLKECNDVCKRKEFLNHKKLSYLLSQLELNKISCNEVEYKKMYYDTYASIKSLCCGCC